MINEKVTFLSKPLTIKTNLLIVNGTGNLKDCNLTCNQISIIHDYYQIHAKTIEIIGESYFRTKAFDCPFLVCDHLKIKTPISLNIASQEDVIKFQFAKAKTVDYFYVKSNYNYKKPGYPSIDYIHDKETGIVYIEIVYYNTFVPSIIFISESRAKPPFEGCLLLRHNNISFLNTLGRTSEIVDVYFKDFGNETIVINASYSFTRYLNIYCERNKICFADYDFFEELRIQNAILTDFEVFVRSLKLESCQILDNVRGKVTELTIINPIMSNVTSFLAEEARFYDINLLTIYETTFIVENSLFEFANYKSWRLTLVNGAMVSKKNNTDFSRINGNYDLYLPPVYDSITLYPVQKLMTSTQFLKLRVIQCQIIPNDEKIYKNLLSNNLIVIFEDKGCLNFHEELIYDVKSLMIATANIYSSQSVKFRPQILNISTNATRIDNNFTCNILSIHDNCLTMIDEISGVEEIDIHYSIYKTGYLYTKKFYYNNQTTRNLHIAFINDDERDQLYYNRDWNNFSIDVFCADEFYYNLSTITSNFTSPHWAFNGITSQFKMDIKK
ncbi:hypothetical protein TVAG_303160 [Trichomonas vaginalis G3]|uniref:Uncharacterized protein n=1 Tax=Trichomonas vaginalis (strain ATCC PRA-98 / G3) TaxID=412133 RepID=A2DQZ8_TRIV3|nr:hypothetical protein TVAGG3_0694280 [Trichomonas vaginalis G3]EAY17097.1 hypothetical protein TVAG_303160 [Trichomonas vaginalis G3]KAI5508801.1 hypothetical protein TVAGG3_0694280 [Trichomonas vaginalis G3]|eukprot:XP_001329320.1 hypothetical protein [Trichomonas vaginalis G3]